MRTEYVGAGQIGRQQVRGKLNALKVSLETAGEGFHRARLGQSRRPLDEYMAVGQQRVKHARYQAFLAEYTPVHEVAQQKNLFA